MNSTITDLIPQRYPMVMVDDLISLDNEVSTTRFFIRPDNIFVDNVIFSECGLIEHIAQSAAARIGYIFSSAGKEIPIGYIGSVNDFEVVRLPKIGETIETCITILQEVFNITLIKADCFVDGKCIASCKMKIFLDTDEKKSQNRNK